jgi:hypothetical protein
MMDTSRDVCQLAVAQDQTAAAHSDLTTWSSRPQVGRKICEVESSSDEDQTGVMEEEEHPGQEEPMNESDDSCDSCDSCDSMAWGSRLDPEEKESEVEGTLEDRRPLQEEEDEDEAALAARRQLSSWLEDVEKKLDFLYNYEPPAPSSDTTEGIASTHRYIYMYRYR